MKSLAGFIFSIAYQKGRNNAVTDALNRVTSKLDTETMKSIMDGVVVGTTRRTDTHNPAVVAADEKLHEQVQKTVAQARATQTYVNLHIKL